MLDLSIRGGRDNRKAEEMHSLCQTVEDFGSSTKSCGRSHGGDGQCARVLCGRARFESTQIGFTDSERGGREANLKAGTEIQVRNGGWEEVNALSSCLDVEVTELGL